LIYRGGNEAIWHKAGLQGGGRGWLMGCGSVLDAGGLVWVLDAGGLVWGGLGKPC